MSEIDLHYLESWLEKIESHYNTLRARADCPDKAHKDDDQDNDECGASPKDLFV